MNKHLWICTTHFVYLFILNILLFLNLSGLVKLWSALTLLGSYQNEACAFRVTQVGITLIYLSPESALF